MTFFRAIGGVDDSGNFQEFKQTAGVQHVLFQDDRPSSLIDQAIAANAAFVVTDHEQAAKSGFYTVLITVPNDLTKQFYVDWSVASQREGKIQILEGVTSVGTPTSKTLQNRNRNSVATTAVTAGVVLNAAGDDPVTGLGGTSIYEHYFPRDVAARHPDGGRLILKDNTVYAFKFDASDTTNNELSFRLDLAEIAA